MASEQVMNDVTPQEDIDYSSSDSWTKSEKEENRWYNPTANMGLNKSDFEYLKSLLWATKHHNPDKTVRALTKLKMERLTDEAYQNMFIAQNGFEVLINILECNHEECKIQSLNILLKMSQNYGVQCSLCDLNVVKPLVSILLFENKVSIRSLAAATLQNISKLRKGRKLIRLNEGVRILVQAMKVPEYIFVTPVDVLSKVNQLIVKLLTNCAGTMNSLCKSLKSQEQLWHCGFMQLVPIYFKTCHYEIRTYMMSLISECCRSRSNAVGQKSNMNFKFKLALKEFNILPQIIQLMVSSTEIAEKAAKTILCMFEDDNSIYDLLLKHEGMGIIFEAIRKFREEQRVMVILITVLWKSSMNMSCREIIVKDDFVRDLLELLSYPYDDRVIGFAVATLTELWKSESVRSKLRLNAVPKYLKLLLSSQHDLILTFVCTAVGMASSDPESLEMINEARGFQMVLVLLPSLDIDEFDKYDYFHSPETIIAATECLTLMIHNMPNTNHFKGMYRVLCDLVDLLTHNNMDILAAACGLIEVVASFDDNLKFMINAGVIENLTKLLPTTYNHLRANLCKALGKCCRVGAKERKMCCKYILEQLMVYMETGDQTVKENLPKALSGLSADPVNCVKIEILGFIPFIRECIKSENSAIAEAAGICMENVRQACAGIGQYRDNATKQSTLTEI